MFSTMISKLKTKRILSERFTNRIDSYNHKGTRNVRESSESKLGYLPNSNIVSKISPNLPTQQLRQPLLLNKFNQIYEEFEDLSKHLDHEPTLPFKKRKFEGKSLTDSDVCGSSLSQEEYDSDHAPEEKVSSTSNCRIKMLKYNYIEIPQVRCEKDLDINTTDRSILFWKPCYNTNDLLESDLEQYLTIAKDNFQYSEEQALGILLWHNYNVSKALEEINNFIPDPDTNDWSLEESLEFTNAINLYGRNFEKIQTRLPHKSIKHLVSYYYKTKKPKRRLDVSIPNNNKQYNVKYLNYF